MSPAAPQLPLAALLARGYARFIAECEARLADAGLGDLTVPHGTNVLRHLGGGRTVPLATVVSLSGVSKQAVSQQVAYLADHGYVVVAPDEHDRRAKSLALTERGEVAYRALRAAFRAVEQDWRERYGAAQVADLRTTLTTVLDDRP